MSSAVVKVAGTAAVPTRLEGNVEVTAEGLISITYKEKGMVKAKTRLESQDSVIAYREGAQGFAVVLSNEPVAQFFGTVTKSNSGVTIKTEEGKVHINTTIQNSLVTFQGVDEDSKEAKLAVRAGKVKAKVKTADGKSSKKDKGDKPKKKKSKK